MQTDIVVGLSFGDEAKGKVVYSLIRDNVNSNKDKYTHSLRVSGSSNAGHTIYHNDKKYVTHLVPAGVFFGIRSLIGPGCVVNVRKFFEEIEYLRTNGIDTKDLIRISHLAHIVTEAHITEDLRDTKIGTTKQGVGPAYRDKYARVGIQAKNIPELKDYLVDFVDDIHNSARATLICEGAQGFDLDIDHGTYPYVTSSHCTVAGALLNGIPHKSVRTVYGVCKAYCTYVGANDFEPKEEIFAKLREVGNEFGSTTGRPRQCNFLNINKLIRATQVNAPDTIVVSKMDVLKKLNCWKALYNDVLLDLKNEDGFKTYLSNVLEITGCHNVIYSYNPRTI